MKEKYSYSTVEKAMIFIAAILFILMSYAYFQDISIRKLLFPSAQDKLLSNPVGKVIVVQGSALRQRASEFEFKGLSVDDKIYPNDTIATGPNSAVKLLLNNGQVVELGANSLVKLTFGEDFSVTGLVRVEVIKSQATQEKAATEAPPPPKESELAVSRLSPAARTTLQFTPEEYRNKRKVVKVEYLMSRPNGRTEVHLFRSSASTGNRVPLTTSTPVTDTEGRAAVAFAFASPGHFDWEVREIGTGKVLAQSSLDIRREIPLIQTNSTRATNELQGMATTREFGGFTLRWSAVAGPADYVVKIFRLSNGQPLLQRRMSATELVLNKNNLILGKMGYIVEKELENGFLAVSTQQEFGFEFLPPAPASPEEGFQISRSDLAENNNLVFFTWSKTNFTDGYEFEIAPDSSFQKPILTKSLKDNFVSIPSLAPGKYYWRARARSHGMWSDYSAARSLQIGGI